LDRQQENQGKQERQWKQLDEGMKWLSEQKWTGDFNQFRNPEWIEGYVRKMMEQTLPSAAAAMGNAVKKGRAEVVETKLYFLVKLPLNHADDLSQIRLQVMEDGIRITGLSGGKQERVRLSKLVLPRYCDARFDGMLLRIRLRKRPRRKQVYHVGIRSSY